MPVPLEDIVGNRRAGAPCVGRMASAAAGDAPPEQKIGKRPPRHLITETRDWARIVLAIGTAIAAIITAVGEVVRQLG